MHATALMLLMATVFAPPVETSGERSTRIYVRTTPPGASIVLDGKELGKSDGLFLVPPGVRKITLEMDGYDPETKTLDVSEGWITRVEVRMSRRGAEPGDADTAASKPEILRFVRWVIQDEQTMTFEGEPVKLEQLPQLLEKVLNREQTVLEVAYSPNISVKLRNEFVARAAGFAQKFGFKYASDIGEQALGSKGSPPQGVKRSEQPDVAIPDTVSFDRTIYDLDEGQGQEAIDLDTGKLYDMPKEIEKWEPVQWGKGFGERGIDLATDCANSQWAIGMIPPAVTLVPADDVKLHEATDRVAGVLAEKEKRLENVTVHRDAGIDFLLLPKGSRPPLNFAFRTAAGAEGFLQIVELNEAKPKSLRLQWKVAKGEGTPGEKDSIARKIHLPDADTKDAPVVLDLASGEMLKLPWESEEDNVPSQETDQDTRYFTKLGKGDLAFDRELFCLRGGTIELVPDESDKKLNMTGGKDDSKAYQLPKLPCELLVTTPEKRRFVVKILDETPAGGLNLEYHEEKGMPEVRAVSMEPRPAAGPSDPEGFTPVRTLLIYDDVSKAACLVDLDTGMLHGQPAREEVKGMTGEEEWMPSKGIDAGCETNAAAPGLWGMDMVVLPVSNDAWEKATVEAIENELRDCKPGSPAIMSTLGGLPRTYYFATREGGKGILQIMAQTKDERGEAYEFRYRLISQSLSVLEFRIVATEQEGKALAETGKDLGWYDASPWMDDTSQLVTREVSGETQILLWQTPEKSLTASQPGEEKWRVVEVSVIAETDKPGRIGVVFDQEGGRRLQELTAANIDRQLALVVDGRVVSCPTIRSPIGERVEITGNFSKADLGRLAAALQAGMEPKRP